MALHRYLGRPVSITVHQVIGYSPYPLVQFCGNKPFDARRDSNDDLDSLRI